MVWPVSPRVSVLLPVHNAEAYLASAIESLQAQSFDDFDVIAIDDGSSDRSGAILDSFAAIDARIHAFHQPKLGLGATLNRALELAVGEYVARMDADDVSLPQRFACQSAYLDQHPDIGVLGSGVDAFDEVRALAWHYPTTDAAIRCQMVFNCAFAHPAVMIRRALLQQLGGYAQDWPVAEDYELWLRVAPFTAFANLPEILLRHRLHADQKGAYDTRTGAMAAAIETLHRRQFAQLGLNPTAAEYSAHRGFSTHQLRWSPDALAQGDTWLSKLLTANRRAGVWPEPTFGRALSERWWFACYHARSQGWRVWRQYWRSILRRASPAPWGQLIRFGAASVWHTLRRSTGISVYDVH
jgi:hypothetical protein